MTRSDRSGSVAATIAERVAERENVAVADLPPLGYEVDTDALDRLASEGVRMDFEYLGYRIVVDDGVSVRVGPGSHGAGQVEAGRREPARASSQSPGGPRSRTP